MIDKLNRWYNALQEPWRFLTALGLASIGIVTLSIGYRPLAFAGGIYLFTLLGIRIRGSFNATT